MVTTLTIRAGDALPRTGWPRRSSGCSGRTRVEQPAAQRETVAARHRKIANQRKDFHHKQARQLVEPYDLLVVEDLKIANMLRRAKPVPTRTTCPFLSNGARAKSGLNRSISDAGWGQFVSILRAKAEDAGRTLD